MMKVYAVFEGTESWDGELLEMSFSGYAYFDIVLATLHAKRVWKGEVREITVYDKLPEFVKQ